MPADKNVRIKGDLVHALEVRARRHGATLNGYVSEVLRAHLQPTDWSRGGNVPWGLTSLAQPLIKAVGTDEVWILLEGGLPPRLRVLAGTVVSAGPTHLRVAIYAAERRVVVVPRSELTAAWMPSDQDDPVPEIRAAVVESGGHSGELMHLLAQTRL